MLLWCIGTDASLVWRFKADCGNMTHAETGFRVLPYRYLARLLEAFGLKAIIVRPGLDGWNKQALPLHEYRGNVGRDRGAGEEVEEEGGVIGF